MKAINLRTEYMTNPIGIDVVVPKFYWNCQGGMKQIAYQIIVWNEDGRQVWDSKRQESSSMTHIPYAGESLRSRDVITWKVRLWDENNQASEWSESANFEMGLLEESDWGATWMTGDYIPHKKERYPVDCFQKSFSIPPHKPLRKARLYVSACGVYEAELNGVKAGEAILSPGITDYRKRIQYQTIDVTRLLKSGENKIMFFLADGWYRGSVGAWAMKNYYGTETKLIAQLELTYEDGYKENIFSGEKFSWSNDGPIRFADNKDGEIFDARKTPSFNGRAKAAKYHVSPVASNNTCITEHERFKASMIQTPSGKTVFDFRQNIAGYVEFHVTAKAGQRIFLRFGEMLDTNGEFTQKNIQCVNKKVTTPLQQIEYFCKEGKNSYKTRFAIFGFQYILVESDVELHPEDMTAIAIYTDMKEKVHFESSNSLLNKFVESTIWSAKNNSADLPTDCPTRERHGWTGDAQIFFHTAAYLLDYANFAKKFQRDLTDWQKPNGKFPQIAPEGGTDPYMAPMNGSSGWADAGVLIPYGIYEMYGDISFLKENYVAMKKYASFVQNRLGKNAILSKRHHVKGENRKYIVNIGQAYGEWAEPAEVHTMSWQDFVIPPTETSTAYAAYIMDVMSKIAGVLGEKKDQDFYKALHHKIKKAYQELVTVENLLDTDRQANLVRPLYFDLLSEDQKEFAKKRLIKALDNYDWRIGTGFLSTPLILDVLSSYDLEAAYRLLENEKMPGWLYMPKAGANTIWESWEGTEAQGAIASLNHYSKGACLEWVFREMCGIKVDGENHFRIAPKPGGHFTYAETAYESLYGKISVRWEKGNQGYRYEVHVPENCSAEIELLDGRKEKVEAGDYIYE